MPVPEFVPSTLVPASQTPSREVLLAQADTIRSDIFPDTYPEKSLGPLGSYMDFALPTNSPLQPLMGTLVYRRHFLNAQERQNGYVPTEETEGGLSVVGLHMHLVMCIDKGYRNVFEETHRSSAALTVVVDYIEERDRLSHARYGAEIDGLVRKQAEEQRANENLSELQRQRQARRSEQIQQTRLRLVRLEFEWLSARAIELTMRNVLTGNASPIEEL